MAKPIAFNSASCLNFILQLHFIHLLLGILPVALGKSLVPEDLKLSVGMLELTLDHLL